MPTQDYAASVAGVAIRVTRLDSVGNLMTGPMDSYTTSSFIRVSFTPEYEAGDEITEKAADGTVFVATGNNPVADTWTFDGAALHVNINDYATYDGRLTAQGGFIGTASNPGQPTGTAFNGAATVFFVEFNYERSETVGYISIRS